MDEAVSDLNPAQQAEAAELYKSMSTKLPDLVKDAEASASIERPSRWKFWQR
ncbi:hypothetical protein J4573_39275 [Actinomadura barringtoniae]|uniref:Uncharacterized protein n=1 Tax=Actinomadura barringtoniae TaxID=1427535 RepID=A0A939TEC0_9ACTN|nr:hypothetical protein [Actinomadura barringtoniae]MBO2453190.1 hypothetical protein [Actinomadura barringtoniae]